MKNLRIVQAVNTHVRYGDTDRRNCHAWAELILLYEDQTWETVFEYRWNDPFNIKKFNVRRLHGRTREEALEILEKEYYIGKLEGIFMD